MIKAPENKHSPHEHGKDGSKLLYLLKATWGKTGEVRTANAVFQWESFNSV
jgi:hypothetical protein